MTSVYSFKDYDKYLSLKPSLAIWAIILYFLRPYIILVSSLRLGFGGGAGIDGLKNMAYPDHLSLALGIFATFPVFLFVVAWARRKPGAPRYVRTIWRNGGAILLFASVLNIIIVFLPLLTGTVHKIQSWGWIQVGIALMIIWYLSFSQRAKGTFEDFPKESESD